MANDTVATLVLLLSDVMHDARTDRLNASSASIRANNIKSFLESIAQEVHAWRKDMEFDTAENRIINIEKILAESGFAILE